MLTQVYRPPNSNFRQATLQSDAYWFGVCAGFLVTASNNWATIHAPGGDLAFFMEKFRVAKDISDRRSFSGFPGEFNLLQNISVFEVMRICVSGTFPAVSLHFAMGHNIANMRLIVGQAFKNNDANNPRVPAEFATSRRYLLKLNLPRGFIDRLNILEARFPQRSDTYMDELLEFEESLGTYFVDEVVASEVVDRYSEIDTGRLITDAHWVLSLARKPDSSHSEHAFLILEGREGNTAHIWFIDFVGRPILPNVPVSSLGDGKIRFKPYEGSLGDKLLFKCPDLMMDVHRGSQILSTSWNVPQSAARQLLESIKAQQSDPPKFNLLGQSSLLAGSTASSSSTSRGHNCFTWARAQLNSLDLNYIVIGDMESRKDYVFARTSRVLPDKRPLSWYQRPEIVAGLAVGSAAVGVAIGKSKTCNIL